MLQVLCGDTELMDPTAAEEALGLSGEEDPSADHGAVTVALLPAFSQVAQLVHVGHAEPARLETCLAQLVAAGAEVHRVVQATLLSSVKHQLRQRTTTEKPLDNTT